MSPPLYSKVEQNEGPDVEGAFDDGPASLSKKEQLKRYWESFRAIYKSPRVLWSVCVLCLLNIGLVWGLQSSLNYREGLGEVNGLVPECKYSPTY